MQTHKLMIKTHISTGLKYLCYTRSDGEEYNNYKGSGKLWKRHLKKYGDIIKTELIYECEDFNNFKNYAIEKSLEYNIINSNEWANLKLEEGDGGDTVSNKRWITDGINDVYILKSKEIPIGWKQGRSNCVFNNSLNQSNFSSKALKENKIKGMTNAWKEGKMDKRDNSKCGIKGDNNPAKRQEVKDKISKAWENRNTDKYKESAIKRANRKITCPYCNNVFGEQGYNRWHGEKCKLK